MIILLLAISFLQISKLRTRSANREDDIRLAVFRSPLNRETIEVFFGLLSTEKLKGGNVSDEVIVDLAPTQRCSSGLSPKAKSSAAACRNPRRARSQ